MTWEDIMKKKEPVWDFVDEVIEYADKLLDKHKTKSLIENYGNFNINDEYELKMELQDILAKIFVSVVGRNPSRFDR